MLYLVFEPLRDSAFGGNEKHFMWAVAGLGAWLGRTVPLLALQYWLNRKPAPTASPVSRAASPEPV